jgi:hypothetical protein
MCCENHTKNTHTDTSRGENTVNSNVKADGTYLQ